ncbi:MAG: hypothetical protein ACOYNC_05625 [Bacteroidales bacterium]
MTEERTPVETTIKPLQAITSRPVFVTVLCLFSFVFYGITMLLFFSGIIYSDLVTAAVDKYLSLKMYSISEIRLIFAAGFILHLMGFAGTVLFWNLRKAGYYLLVFSSIIIAALQTLRADISVISTAVYILLILLFGVFYRRLH